MRRAEQYKWIGYECGYAAGTHMGKGPVRQTISYPPWPLFAQWPSNISNRVAFKWPLKNRALQSHHFVCVCMLVCPPLYEIADVWMLVPSMNFYLKNPTFIKGFNRVLTAADPLKYPSDSLLQKTRSSEGGSQREQWIRGDWHPSVRLKSHLPAVPPEMAPRG